jgi:hypothetical protein
MVDFQFSEESNSQEPRYFSEVFERFRKAYEEKITAMREATAEFQPVQGLRQFMVESASELDFHPVQEFRNLVAGTSRTIGKAEESAIATASLMYESLVPASMDKQLSAMSQATFTQVTEAWNSVKHMKEWLETARSLKHQRQRIRQQLKGYRELLSQIREAAVPSKDVASIMMRITECNEALHRLDSRAQRTFVQTTGFSPLFERTRPIRFAKYSSDPLLGIATYPLAFHMLVLGLTELPLRALMYKRGFERRIMGSVAYYYHPGMDDVSSSLEESDEPSGPMPIVFVHGIGLGLLPYMPLIDALLKTGRPLLLPEVSRCQKSFYIIHYFGVISHATCCLAALQRSDPVRFWLSTLPVSQCCPAPRRGLLHHGGHPRFARLFASRLHGSFLRHIVVVLPVQVRPLGRGRHFVPRPHLFLLARPVSDQTVRLRASRPRHRLVHGPHRRGRQLDHPTVLSLGPH